MTNIEKIKALSDNELIELAKTHVTKSKILLAVGIKYKPIRCWHELSKRLDELNVDTKKKVHPRHYDREVFQKAVTENNSFTGTCKSLGITACTANFNNIRRFCKEWDISYDHFDGRKAKGNGNSPKWTAKNIFVENCSISRGSLRKVLIRLGLYPGKCEECGISDTWRKKPLIIEIDHINGDCSDNRKENLMWLCPNCHSQTKTYRWLNT